MNVLPGVINNLLYLVQRGPAVSTVPGTASVYQSEKLSTVRGTADRCISYRAFCLS